MAVAWCERGHFHGKHVPVEDRVCGECGVNVVGPRFLYNASIDPMLGTGVEARQSIGSSLCQRMSLWIHRIRCTSIRLGIS